MSSLQPRPAVRRALARPHLRERIDATPLSAEARLLALRELDQIEELGPAHSIGPRAHLEWLLSLPWRQSGVRRPAIAPRRVVNALDRSHLGLKSVKERIAEYLAVHRLRGAAGGDVLGFVGPPGTGKTSLARALALALGRPFVWIPVGAVTAESELVGVPVTQPGAMPGAILEGLRRAGSSDAVVVLDELDKLQLGASGEALGTLLALFDREARSEFFDRYLGLPFDLSGCLIVATAHDTEEMPEALLDRLDVVEFNGYSEEEKARIARRHLVPGARAQAGVSAKQFRLTSGALNRLLTHYTEEAGVRQLERQLCALARKAAMRVVQGRAGLAVKQKDLAELLGPASRDEELRARRPALGAATGLAWTSAGGTLLPVEALAAPGSGKTKITGQVGEILRESVETAVSCVRSLAQRSGASLLDERDLHLHFPSSAVPKDGPSAGLAIAVALYSLCSRRRVRHDVALTGELTLYGAVLAIGGVREKLLAARRAGLREVIVPEGNGQDLLQLPVELRKAVKIHRVSNLEQALAIALTKGKSRSGGSVDARPYYEPKSAARARKRRVR
jgi:ATP-dependent Lon protease